MNLVGFSIENVRSIRNPVFVRDLRRWEVMHGDNNVGKSNLLLGIRCAIILIDKVWSHSQDEVEDDVSETPSVVRLPIEDLPEGLVPHWDRENDPIILALQFETPEILTVQFTLQRRERHWHIEGRWAAQQEMDLRHLAPTVAPFPYHAPDLRFVDAGRQPPSGFVSWDEWLLSQLDEDRDGGPWLAAYRRLELALLELVPSFEKGRLTHQRVKDSAGRRSSSRGRGREGVEERRELVWWTDTNRRLRFDDQGSGVRALKDLLIAATAGSGICLLEEPELHLSESLQLRLRKSLEQLAAPSPELKPLQMILTSHTAMFDQIDSRKVSIENGSTMVAPQAPRASQGNVNQAWIEAGGHNAGYVSSSGILRLPPSVQNTLHLPVLVRFTEVESGFFMAADNQDDVS